VPPTWKSIDHAHNNSFVLEEIGQVGKSEGRRKQHGAITVAEKSISRYKLLKIRFAQALFLGQAEAMFSDVLGF
jgi:hypothetical protein